MGCVKEMMLKRAERGEHIMECPDCGADMITDQYEDCELVYCVKCGYQTVEDSYQELDDDGEPVSANINEDDWRIER
jgi:Zn ribbon nucleic-acid-binding protein